MVTVPPILPEDYFERPDDLTKTTDPGVLFARSYLLIRAMVGLIGVALPIFFVIAEAAINRSVHFRGSVSAYYHSPVRDVFVGGLSVIGFLLIMYMAGQKKRWDWLFSTVAGASLIVVVLLPTKRPGIQAGAPLCGTDPEPPGCSWVQQRLGEQDVFRVHITAAGVFILSLAVICFYWALRDVERRKRDPKGRKKTEADPGQQRWARVWQFWRLWRAGGLNVWVPAVCGLVIVAAVLWVVVGVDIWELTPLYLTEIVSDLAFAVAWLYAGRDLFKLWANDATRSSVQAAGWVRTAARRLGRQDKESAKHGSPADLAR